MKPLKVNWTSDFISKKQFLMYKMKNIKTVTYMMMVVVVVVCGGTSVKQRTQTALHQLSQRCHILIYAIHNILSAFPVSRPSSSYFSSSSFSSSSIADPTGLASSAGVLVSNWYNGLIVLSVNCLSFRFIYWFFYWLTEVLVDLMSKDQ